MNRLLILPAAAAAVLLAVATAQAQNCPADASKASRTLWASGSISTGKSVSGMHPCGRRITCTGGTSSGRGSRNCHWG
jgi:hypothetical protein